MVLYLVYKMGLMFEPHSDSDAFCLDSDVLSVKIAVDVARTVSSGKDDRAHELPCCLLAADVVGLFCLNPDNGIMAGGSRSSIARSEQAGHARPEMHLAARGKDCLPHVLYYSRQFVGTYMRMCVDQYVGRSSMLTEDVQDFLHPQLFQQRFLLLVYSFPSE